MLKVSRSLFYFLILFLPTQLGRHFFLKFSFVDGVRSDYLAPTVYFTDVIILLMFVSWIVENKGRLQVKFAKYHYFFKIYAFFLLYLIFNSLFIAESIWPALYKLVKIVEFTLLGLFIIDVRPSSNKLLAMLSLAVIYSSFLAIFQFLYQGSAGGLFWWLGERSFYASTPGIATFSYFGRLLLRPYATFPHPNVLGGFLSLSLTSILFILLKRSKRVSAFNILCLVSVILGFIALILTFSRSAWIVLGVGILLMLLQRNRKMKVLGQIRRYGFWVVTFFYLLIILSVVAPVMFPMKEKSLAERSDLITISLNYISKKPMFGVGLNNFISSLVQFSLKKFQISILQPVHNIYLLVFSELGLVGLIFLLLFLSTVFKRSLEKQDFVAVSVLQLFLLGLFDHYLFTLQQGQLLFILFVSLGMYKHTSETPRPYRHGASSLAGFDLERNPA